MKKTGLMEHSHHPIIVNYSAEASVVNSSVRSICGTAVAKTIAEAQKIIKVNSYVLF